MERLSGRVGRFGGMVESNVDFVLAKRAVGRRVSPSGDASGVESGVLRAVPSSEVSNPVKAGSAGRFAKREVGCFLSRNDNGSSGNLKIGMGGTLLSEEVGIPEV